MITYRPGCGDYSSNQVNIVIFYNVFSPLPHGCIYIMMGGIRMCNLQPPPPQPDSRRKQMANKQVCCIKSGCCSLKKSLSEMKRSVDTTSETAGAGDRVETLATPANLYAWKERDAVGDVLCCVQSRRRTHFMNY